MQIADEDPEPSRRFAPGNRPPQLAASLALAPLDHQDSRDDDGDGRGPDHGVERDLQPIHAHAHP
jgi:hypothetical protein